MEAGTIGQMMSVHWPLYDLRLRTPRLELRLPDLAELDALAELSRHGVHDSGEMPFAVPWTDLPADERARSVMQFHWRQLAEWTPQNWSLQLIVLLDGTVVGAQSVGGRDFAVVREARTGSWLGRRFQGQGIGTEMRAAVLDLAFTGLGAEVASSGAFTTNLASAAVSRKLGYQPNGMARRRVRDTVVHERRFALTRDQWQQHHAIRVEIIGLERCLPLLGLPG